MRVSTQSFYDQSRAGMAAQQSSLLRVQQQIGAMTKILAPSDDPLGATRALAVSQSIALNSQYATSRAQATQTLSLEENNLQSATTVLQNIKSLLIEAGNGTMTDADRGTLATTLQSAFDQLQGMANADDGNGQFLFAGFKSGSPPFVKQPDGSILYAGDQGQRLMQVDVSRQMAGTDDGRSIFQSVQGGAGYVSQQQAGNTGSGVFGASSVVNIGDANYGKDFVITFTTPTTYQVDTNTVPPVAIVPSTTFTAGSPIQFGGLQLNITGAPAAGDSFHVATAKNAGTDVFATISDAIKALRTPVDSAGPPGKRRPAQRPEHRQPQDHQRPRQRDHRPRLRRHPPAGTRRPGRHRRQPHPVRQELPLRPARPRLRQRDLRVLPARDRAAGEPADLCADPADFLV
jgi:flagellar hook-associated protein 3 FlgL